MKRRILRAQDALECLGIVATFTGYFPAGCALFMAAMYLGAVANVLRDERRTIEVSAKGDLLLKYLRQLPSDELGKVLEAAK